MAVGQRDNVGVGLWCALAAGGLMAAAACGDLRHLLSLFDAGVIMACGSAISLLSRWVSRGQVPGSATAITDAPSVLALAEENAEEIRTLKTRVSGIFLLMGEQTAEDQPGVRDDARQMPRQAVILQFPQNLAKGSSGDSQAGLCAAARAPLGLLCR